MHWQKPARLAIALLIAHGAAGAQTADEHTAHHPGEPASVVAPTEPAMEASPATDEGLKSGMAAGGMAASGILGMFIGATLLSIGYRIFMAWVNEGLASADK